MRSINELTDTLLRSLRVVLTDIDDTMTIKGELPWQAYKALSSLKKAGFIVIPVTGRPAGWCDMIARFWPVSGVVGENGAFAFYREGQKIKRIFHPEADRVTSADVLERIRQRVLEEVPGSRIAADQFARMFDLAIDFNEEPPYLGRAAAVKIRDICEAEGAVAKISSIHVNTWVGNYDKVSMTLFFLKNIFSIDLDKDPRCAIFCGDSPNDVPFFKYLPLSCGVANCRDYIDLMEYKPTYVTLMDGGFGFAELAERIVRAVGH